MSKDFEQQLQDLEDGIKQIDNIIKEPKTFRAYERAKQTREIQVARIEFFKKGYKLCQKEIKSQKSLE